MSAARSGPSPLGGDLRSQLDVLGKRLREVNQQLKQASKKDKRRASTKGTSTFWILCGVLRHTNGCFAAVEAYLRFKNVRGVSGEDALRDARAWWRVKSQDTAGVSLPPAGGDALRGYLEAERFLKEYDLQVWISRQNLEKGMTPSSHAVLQQCTRLAGESQAGALGGSASQKKTRLQWLRRFRRRWRVRLGKITEGEHMSAQEKRAKVSGSFWRHCSPPKEGVSPWAGQKCVRFLDAKMVPPVENTKEPAPENGLLFFSGLGKFPKPVSAQADAVWQWRNLLATENNRTREPALCINFDETNVRLYGGATTGHLSVEAWLQRRKPQSLKRNVSRGQMRASATHLLCICNDMEVQRSLPQYIIVKAALVAEDICNDIRRSLPPNVHLLRMPKAWVNTAVMLRYVDDLAKAVSPHRGGRPVLIFADAFKAHITSSVLARLGKHALRMCLIPAKMTWALQPCDTHCFADYKFYLQRYIEEDSIARDTGNVSWGALVACIAKVLRERVEAKPWAKAFLDAGLDGSQRAVSKRVLAKLEYPTELPAVGEGFPSLQQLELIFPARTVIPISELFSGLRAEHKRVRARSVEKELADAQTKTGVDPHPWPWYGRTRSTSAQVFPSASASSSASCPAHLPASSSTVSSTPPPVFLPAAKRFPRLRSWTASLPPRPSQ